MVNSGLFNNFVAREVFGAGTVVRRILCIRSHVTKYFLNSYPFSGKLIAWEPIYGMRYLWYVRHLRYLLAKIDSYYENPYEFQHFISLRGFTFTVSCVQTYQVRKPPLQMNYLHFSLQPWCGAALAPTMACSLMTPQPSA
jgi:hypothetical protein